MNEPSVFLTKPPPEGKPAADLTVADTVARIEWADLVALVERGEVSSITAHLKPPQE